MNLDDIDRLVSSKSRPSPAPPAAAVHTLAQEPPPSESKSRYDTHGKPLHYAFMADPFNLVMGMNEINEHARECGTDLTHVSRDDVHYYGLCGSIDMRCMKGKHCRHWQGGVYRMYTQTPIPTQTFGESHDIDDEVLPKWEKFMPKLEYRANILHATAESITSVMPAESERVLVLLGLKVRRTQVRRTKVRRTIL